MNTPHETTEAQGHEPTENAAPVAAQPPAPLPRPRAERPLTDAQMLDAVLATQERVQDVLFEIAEIMKARGARKVEMSEAFKARHAGTSPEAALNDAALQLLGLRVRTEQARKDAEWLRATAPKKVKAPKPKAAPRPKQRRPRTLTELLGKF